MTVGEKIKKFRTARELSQKQLASMSGMSEPAIRNYELGNRQPSEKQIEKIADALGISTFALSNPNVDSYIGLMHTLFSIEDLYGLTPEEIEGRIVLRFEKKDPAAKTVSEDLRKWSRVLEDLRQGKISQEEYDLWRYSYPKMEAARAAKARDEARKHEKD